MKLLEVTSCTGKRVDLFHCFVVSTGMFSGWLHPNPTYIPLTGNGSSQQDMLMNLYLCWTGVTCQRNL